PRRTGPDHNEVTDRLAIDLRIHLQALGELFVAGILRHLLAATDDNRYVVDRHMKPIEQRLHTAVAFNIEVDVRVGVARQELLHTQRARGVPRADQNDISLLRGDKGYAPQDECAHEQLAQHRVRLDDDP